MTSAEELEKLSSDDYIAKYVDPVLEPLGEALARAMPQNAEDFVVEWLEARSKKESAETKQVDVPGEARKEYVKTNVMPLIVKLSYECIRARCADPVEFLLSNKSWMKRDDDASDEDNSGDELEGPEVPEVMRRRRSGVSAEKLSAEDVDNWVPPKHEKPSEERQILKSTIRTSKDGKLHMLFGLVSEETLEQVVDAMFTKEVKDGEAVIEQGATGDYFYIVKDGLFEIFVQKGGAERKKVWEAGQGFAFGELALMYNAPRSATIISKGNGVVWALDRMAFRMLVVRAQEIKWKEYNDFLAECEIFSTCSVAERASLAEILQEEDFDDGEAILEQGERDDSMFILQRGEAVACISGESGEVEVKRYKQGDYFGEIALLLGEPRKASVYALGPCRCVYVTRASARRVLGPMQDILKRNMDKYSAYADAIKQAETEEGNGGMDDEEGAVKKAGRRKRDPMAMAAADHAAKREDEGKADEQQMSLKDKIALDFKRPNLVMPVPEFDVKDARLYQFGALREGQKFQMDKPIVTRVGGNVSKREEEGGIMYDYSVPTALKGPTHVAIFCQKGQKSAEDPTPNQDNYFQISLENGIDMFGIADGHGPFGHIVSLRLVQSIPHYLTKSAHFPGSMEAAITEAFKLAQEDLVSLSKREDMNFDASGSTGSIMVLQEQVIHLAWIGDSRLFVGSWNRHDSRLIECTADHKPDLPAEKERIEATGNPPGEVRDVGGGSHRIYIKGENYPGLTMSRAFGDFACCERGVIQVPDYKTYSMQPGDEWYAIVASDGIWEFIDGENAITMTAKKLRLKGPRETLRFLIDASRKRWVHFEGEYCDDITGMLIQWNMKDKEGSAGGNHHVWTVTPPEAHQCT